MLCRSIPGTSTLISAAILLTACSKADTGAADTMQSGAATVAGDTSMGSMSGMDHSAMTSTPAKDSDQEFVRMMVDHHQGLIALSDTALAMKPSEHIMVEARDMSQKQRAEQKKMIAMLKADYGEEKMAMIMPSNAAMISEVASKVGKDLDRTFREKVIAHHEEALKMVDDYMPKFTKPAVRTMATKMKADQQKEIAVLKSELQKM